MPQPHASPIRKKETSSTKGEQLKMGTIKTDRNAKDVLFFEEANNPKEKYDK